MKLPPIFAPEEKTQAKLTNFDEIQQLKELFKQKKEKKELMEQKYKPIIKNVTETTKKNNLNYKLVVELLMAQFATEKESE